MSTCLVRKFSKNLFKFSNPPTGYKIALNTKKNPLIKKTKDF